MALNHKRLLKKKQKKDKKKRALHAKNKAETRPLTERSLYAAWSTPLDDDATMISTVFVRRLNTDQFHVTGYLIDALCLGIKNAYMRRISLEQYERNFENNLDYRRVEAGCLKTLVLEAASYGEKNGFSPSGEYKDMLPYIINIDTENSPTHDVRFGDENGKAYYIANPDPEIEPDTLIRERLDILTEKLGAGNFEFLVPVSADSMDK